MAPLSLVCEPGFHSPRRVAGARIGYKDFCKWAANSLISIELRATAWKVSNKLDRETQDVAVYE